MKKIISILLSLLCLLSLNGCGSKKDEKLLGVWIDDPVVLLSHPDDYLTITEDQIITFDGREVWNYEIKGNGKVQIDIDDFKCNCKYKVTNSTLQWFNGGDVDKDEENWCPLADYIDMYYKYK